MTTKVAINTRKKVFILVLFIVILFGLASYSFGYLNPVLNMVTKSQTAAVVNSIPSCPAIGICNVTVSISGQSAIMVTQGTNVNVEWSTAGSVPKIDVLVCVSGGSCYKATNNMNVLNTNSASNIRVGTNIPIGKTAYIKVRPAGNDSLKALSEVFLVQSKIPNLNLGTITVRAIVANIDEVGNKYGSYGMKFPQSKLTEVDQALQKLNTFVKQSSFGKAQLQWTTSGVYELGNGVCNQPSYGDKVNNLIQRALTAADLETPFTDYSYYIIVHPMPDCQDGVMWSFEGRGQFKPYIVNGRTVHLRGVRISDLSDQYLFHEFGHSLAYQANTSIGHPDYLNCPITKSNGEIKIELSSTCSHVFDFNSGNIPIFTMMSTPSILSDYSSIEKEIAGWLTSPNILTTTSGTYTLSSLEQSGTTPKALKIPITGTGYVVYVSFRQPAGYTYPATSGSKPNGVILDITNGSVESFLVTNNTDKNVPLQTGVKYRVGTNGPVITVNSISNNLASVTVSSN